MDSLKGGGIISGAEMPRNLPGKKKNEGQSIHFIIGFRCRLVRRTADTAEDFFLSLEYFLQQIVNAFFEAGLPCFRERLALAGQR